MANDDLPPDEQTPASRRVLVTPPPRPTQARAPTTPAQWRKVRPHIGPNQRGKDPTTEFFKLSYQEVFYKVSQLRGVYKLHDEVPDLVQGYYDKIIVVRHGLHTLDPERGRLRGWIGKTVRNYMRDLARVRGLNTEPLLEDDPIDHDRPDTERMLDTKRFVSLADLEVPGWRVAFDPDRIQASTHQQANRIRQMHHHGRRKTVSFVRTHYRLQTGKTRKPHTD